MHQMTDEQKKRVEDNLRLATYTASKWSKKTAFLEFNELLSLCNYALCKASKTFDPERGVSFATLAVRCMDNEVLMSLRSRNRHPTISLSTILGEDSDGNILRVEDTLESNDPLRYTQIEAWETVKKLIRSLDQREKKIIWDYFFDGQYEKKQQAIADKMGLTQSYVSRIKKNALDKMGRQFNKPRSI